MSSDETRGLTAVDIDPRTFNIDPARIAEAVTPRTTAIIPVHLFGQMCDMDPIMEIASRHGIPAIEDAAQAISASYKGRRAEPAHKSSSAPGTVLPASRSYFSGRIELKSPQGYSHEVSHAGSEGGPTKSSFALFLDCVP